MGRGGVGEQQRGYVHREYVVIMSRVSRREEGYPHTHAIAPRLDKRRRASNSVPSPTTHMHAHTPHTYTHTHTHTHARTHIH
jgi:hypothetical protein